MRFTLSAPKSIFEAIGRKRLVIPVCSLFIAAALWFLNGSAFSADNSSVVDYFEGMWTVKLRNDPNQTFRWTVKKDLDGSWLSGVVERKGARVSTDFWRINGQKIERFAFTGQSVFVRIESAGWDGDKMIMTGVLSDKPGETKVRETITRVSDKEFYALWEMEGPDGKWTVFGDEICTKD